MNAESGSVSTSLQAGYILHYTQWQETSFIVDAFTLEHGRIALMAKSARASKPRVRALYQPFRPLLLSWVGAGDLRTLTGIEESGKPMNMADAPLACAYYINELVLRLLGKDQPQAMVFAHYALALSELDSQQVSMEAVLRTFELQLLDALGTLPNLSRCTADGSDIDPDLEYRFHPANAVAVPQHNAEQTAVYGIQKDKTLMGEGDSRNVSLHPDGMTADKGIRVSGATLLAMASLDFTSAAVLEEAKAIMKPLMRVQLGDKPLKSRELFESFVRNKQLG
ncbi:MAG: DNA repair protein RecO [Granulosicoccus sp.]